MSSKYKGKKAFKKGGKAAKVREAGAPTFLYTSVCHSAPAIKPPCIADGTDESKSTLGTWLCSQCKRKTAVTVKFNKEGIDPFAKPMTAAQAIPGFSKFLEALGSAIVSVDPLAA